MNKKISYKELSVLSDHFINENMKVKNNYSDSIIEFELLSNFIRKYNIVIDLDFCINLLNKNITLYNLIDTIFSNISKVNKQPLKIDSTILNIYDGNDILQNFIIAYCIINKIEIIDDDYDIRLERLEDAFDSSDIDIIKIYLNELNKKLLTKEDEKALAIKIQKGDKKAKDELIEANLRLVVSIAKKYINRGLSLEDLIQEGNIALVKAANNYKINRGYRFTTYATSCIKGYLIRALENKSKIIRIPCNVYPVLNNFKYEVEYLTKKLGRNPSIKEISVHLNISENKVSKLFLLDNEIESLNKLVGEELESELIEFIPYDDKEVYVFNEQEFLKDDLLKIIEKSKLTDKEKEILLLRFYNNKLDTFEDIGKYLGITHQAAHDKYKRAIIKLRKNKNVKKVANYCDFPEQALANLEKFNIEYEEEHKKKLSKKPS